MIDYKFDKSEAYLVACTFGPDSMALVSMLQNEGIKPIVIYINYHSFADEDKIVEALRKYCEEHSLILEYREISEDKDVNDPSYKKWARETRYKFFHEVYDKYDANALFLAHTQDDLLETILVEKERKGKKASYSMSPVSMVDGMMVVRPLLQYTKEELLSYDIENFVPFSDEVSNHEVQVLKDSVHSDVIAKLTLTERENLIDEMRQKKDDKIRFVESINQEIDAGEELDIRTLIALEPDVFADTMIRFIHRVDESVKISDKKLAEIRAFMLSKVSNDSLLLKGDTYLIKEYDIVLVGKNLTHLPYTYVLEKEGKLSTKDFDIDFSMGAEDRGITKDDYPLTIRTALPTDNYIVHGYLQNVRSLLSSWNMPVNLRRFWPVFVNKDGKIIYVPRYRKNFVEYHNSVLKMHIDMEE